MNGVLKSAVFGAFCGIVHVSAYGSYGKEKPQKAAERARTSYEGKEVVLSGWLSGTNCFVMGHSCTPDHIMMKR